MEIKAWFKPELLVPLLVTALLIASSSLSMADAPPKAGPIPIIKPHSNMMNGNVEGGKTGITSVRCDTGYDCRLTGCKAPVCLDHICTCPPFPPAAFPYTI